MENDKPFSLFEVFGIELEYMLVHKDTLDVLPSVDALLKKAAGEYTTDFVENGTGWANELALHVMEIRTEDPSPSLSSLPKMFAESVKKANAYADSMGAALLPSAMHPWMMPSKETKLWPHEYHEIYRHFDNIFNCKRHGWANLQSCQLNLPFSGDEEFGRLHAAIRFLLPLLPALAASSPIAEGRTSGYMNYRLHVYKDNAAKAPLVAGSCIPEPFYTKQDYEKRLLQPIYEQIKPFDPEGILQFEWLNARGAIARFDRDAIEIRILDMQEHPGADIAICETISETLKKIIFGDLVEVERLKPWPTAALKSILDQHVLRADEAVIEDQEYLSAWGIKESRIQSKELWQHIVYDLLGETLQTHAGTAETLKTIFGEGVLSRRILKACGGSPSKEALRETYSELKQCLAESRMFHA